MADAQQQAAAVAADVSAPNVASQKGSTPSDEPPSTSNVGVVSRDQPSDQYQKSGVSGGAAATEAQAYAATRADLAATASAAVAAYRRPSPSRQQPNGVNGTEPPPSAHQGGIRSPVSRPAAGTPPVSTADPPPPQHQHQQAGSSSAAPTHSSWGVASATPSAPPSHRTVLPISSGSGNGANHQTQASSAGTSSTYVHGQQPSANSRYDSYAQPHQQPHHQQQQQQQQQQQHYQQARQHPSPVLPPLHSPGYAASQPQHAQQSAYQRHEPYPSPQLRQEAPPPVQQRHRLPSSPGSNGQHRPHEVDYQRQQQASQPQQRAGPHHQQVYAEQHHPTPQQRHVSSHDQAYLEQHLQHPQHHQPHQQKPYQPLVVSKPIIVDPPATRTTPRRMISLQSFPSPVKDYAKENPQWTDDINRLTSAVRECLPEAVRRVVRDNWEKCLLGSEFHQAFILNASIHHASGEITRRAIRDFGEKMVVETKYELANQLKSGDLDDIADILLEKASNRFLDKALERRLKTIETKLLVDALARAERLGYEPSNVLEEDARNGEGELSEGAYGQSWGESPSLASLGSEAWQSNFAAQSNDAARKAYPPQGAAAPQTADGQFQCPICWRSFDAASAYDHHVKKKVCQRQPPRSSGFKFQCTHCGQGFTTIVGLQYHDANKVCGDFTSNGEQPPSPAAAQASSAPPPTAISDVAQNGSNGPPAQAQYMAARGPVAQSQQPAPTNFQATPSHKFRKPSTTTSPPGVSSPADPYAHLTPERRAQMEAELKQAENAYSGRFREAEAIADPVEAKTRIDSLKNSYNTKQSMIRKKYGVRLRERRTRAQIEEERQRMGLKGIHTVSSSAAGTPSKAATQAQPRIVSSTASAPPPPASQPAPAAPRVSGWTSINAGPSAAALDADASKGPSSTAPETASATEYSRAEKRRRTDSGDSDSVTARDNTSALAQAAEALFAQHYRATHAVTNGTTGGDGGGRAASSEGNSRPGSSSGAAATGGRTPLPSGSGAGAGVKRDVDGDVRMRRTSESPSPKPVANGPVRRPPDVRAGDGDVSSDSDSDIGDIPPTLPGSGGSTSQQQNRIASSGAPAQAPPRLAA